MNAIALILSTIALTVSSWFGIHDAQKNTPNVNLGANSTISNLPSKTSLAGTDLLVMVDNAGTPTTKNITVTNASSSFKTFNDATYSPIAGGSGIVTVGTIASGVWNG